MFFVFLDIFVWIPFLDTFFGYIFLDTFVQRSFVRWQRARLDRQYTSFIPLLRALNALDTVFLDISKVCCIPDIFAPFLLPFGSWMRLDRYGNGTRPPVKNSYGSRHRF